MAKTCMFCGDELSLLNRTKLYSFGTEQIVCKKCYQEAIKLPADERARRILATGQAVAADFLQSELNKKLAEEESKRARRISNIICPNCNVSMLKMGQQQFQLGEHSLFLGDLSHMMAGSLTLDLMCCEKCRKVEFYLPDDVNVIDSI